jgi:hypothetical protein
LRHFSTDKGNKFGNGSIFRSQEEADLWDPPLLYKRPDDDAFKWMIGRYLEMKKLL